VWLAVCYPADGVHLSARRLGNVLRFANHAPSTAATLAVHPLIVDGVFHMVALTSRAVDAAEQLTLDYGGGFWRGRQHVPVAMD
jgi:SET domain-containing protein